MRHARWAARATAAGALLFLAGLGPPGAHPPPPMLQQAKLGFSYLSAEQYKDLWRRADDYALAESFSSSAGQPPDIERRMRWLCGIASRPRARQGSRLFRRKVAEHSTRADLCCETEQSKALIKTIAAKSIVRLRKCARCAGPA